MYSCQPLIYQEQVSLKTRNAPLIRPYFALPEHNNDLVGALCSSVKD